MSLLAIHVHFLADLVGSAGPDGSIWAIHYSMPFSTSWEWSVSWQWALNAWPNIALTVSLIAVALHSAWKHGVSPVGILSKRADQMMVNTLRYRFGEPATTSESR